MTVTVMESRQDLVRIYAAALSSYERPPAASRHFSRSNNVRNDCEDWDVLLILVEMDSVRLRVLCPATQLTAGPPCEVANCAS
jgi:hypothetical protein